MFFLRELPKNLRVLVLEKGQVQPHADQLKRNIQVEEDIPVENTSGYLKTGRRILFLGAIPIAGGRRHHGFIRMILRFNRGMALGWIGRCVMPIWSRYMRRLKR